VAAVVVLLLVEWHSGATGILSALCVEHLLLTDVFGIAPEDVCCHWGWQWYSCCSVWSGILERQRASQLSM